MKKILSLFRGTRREEGMALLFALGFLAMMLILGLAFVTTSLLAQKIAANNSSRAQARMFARSAAARAMLNIMLYNDQAALQAKNIEDYDSIYSRDEAKYNNGSSTSSGIVSDQLHRSNENSSDESKLKYQVGSEDYTGENCKAQWMFFYDSPKGTAGRKIIGRAAFQVLPRQAGRLSLYAITGGSVKDGDFGQNTHNFRWGRDIAELNLKNTETLRNWYDSVSSANIPYKYETMYTSYGSFFSSNPDMKKRWLEYWFAEGKNPILKDAFPKLDPNDKKGKKIIYINRFNISDYYYSGDARNSSANDNWYDRFKQTGHRTKGWTGDIDGKKNSRAALNALAQDAVAYKENHTEDSEVDPSGLPFLKRIGNEAWSFENLKTLRLQIAANFNDYCDADSIPTSDLKASEWSITGTAPTYTGNEKTLYINEVSAELGRIDVVYDKTNYALQIDNPSNIKFKLWVELIRMYDNSDADNSKLLDPANLKVEAGIKQLAFKYTLTAKYTGKVKYTYVKNNTTKTGEKEFNTADISADAVINLTDSGAVTIGGDKFTSNSNAPGYYVGNVELTTLTVTNPEASVFTEAVNDKAKEVANDSSEGEPATVTEITITEVKVKCQLKPDTGAGVALMPVLLRANKDITVGSSSKVICPQNAGVDFVRFDETAIMNFAETPEEISKTLNDSSGWKPNIYDTYFIGGIEARDPRQNLNAIYSTDAGKQKKSDWNLAPKLVVGSKAKTDSIPSLTIEESPITVGGTTVGNSYTVSGGKVNANSSPKAPNYVSSDGTATLIEASTRDAETAEDPAWLGDSHGQHVSTAYIRNSPMVSPWEIGLIHRGREWQTLNIKRAGGFGDDAEVQLADIDSGYDDDDGENAWTNEPGTAYQNGDGAILEFIKVGVSCRCMGKVPLTLLATKVIKEGGSDWNEIDEAYNKDVIKMLFDGIRKGQTMKQFYAETKFGEASGSSGTSITVDTGDITDFVKEIDRLCALSGNEEFRMRSQFLNSEYGDRNGKYTFEMAEMDNDAQREELIGKTINLLTVNEVTPPNIFRVIVVAQSIKDVGGIGSDSAAIPITKIHKGNSKELDCLIGRFDFVSESDNWENNTYYDEITGEVKALVTIERIPAVDENGDKNKDYGRMVITGIEFID